jgi:putative acetyltransferase
MLARQGEGMRRIIPADLDDPEIVELLRRHVTRARAETAPESAHALDLDGLKSPEIAVWAIWDGDTLLGVGALKRLSQDHGEVKSMHTAEAARRRGAGRAMLDHIVAAARAQGLARLSLETGASSYFWPAQALYRGRGFVDCPPFADYIVDPNSVYLTLDLRAAAASRLSD